MNEQNYNYGLVNKEFWTEEFEVVGLEMRDGLVCSKTKTVTRWQIWLQKGAKNVRMLFVSLIFVPLLAQIGQLFTPVAMLTVPCIFGWLVGFTTTTITSCPQCKKAEALFYTGTNRNSSSYGPGVEEYQCRYCSHTTWKKASLMGGGYGGYSGDGGDGGDGYDGDGGDGYDGDGGDGYDGDGGDGYGGDGGDGYGGDGGGGYGGDGGGGYGGYGGGGYGGYGGYGGGGGCGYSGGDGGC